MQVLLPPGWPRPKGYSNGVSASGRTIYVAGMIGWDSQSVFHTDDMAGQVRLALENIVAVLSEGGARPEHIVRWGVISRPHQANLTQLRQFHLSWLQLNCDRDNFTGELHYV